ncbi:MAG: 4Fe-4S binding protein [Christensenellaceae bacterium]|nr:4Fe-4S binding protein [Christensenellaceae bacterium]
MKKATAIVFSPTKSTLKIANLVLNRLGLPVETIDITPYKNRSFSYDFKTEDITVFAVPVYGGRVPKPAMETIKNIKGNYTPAILVAVYGNRAYDDALLELKNILVENGFVPIAAGAFVAKHSIMKIAKGRPNNEDIAEIEFFADKALDSIQGEKIEKISPVDVPGNFPYVEPGGKTPTPLTNKDCIKCGACSRFCPVGAISKKSPNKTDYELCIGCMACIKICPNKARHLDKEKLKPVKNKFKEMYAEPRAPECFYI